MKTKRFTQVEVGNEKINFAIEKLATFEKILNAGITPEELGNLITPAICELCFLFKTNKNGLDMINHVLEEFLADQKAVEESDCEWEVLEEIQMRAFKLNRKLNDYEENLELGKIYDMARK